ncbi:MAG: exocyst complex component Sec6 family protein [Eubacterium sp.]|nr:exocyst complex component Sec6 family protein [Eubacterium sp.]
MRDIKRLCEKIETELNNIAEKGLTTGNIDTAYKLIDMYKDIKNTEYWETKSEYYDAVLDEMQGGEYSSKRDSMGRYSRDGERTDRHYDMDSSYRGRRRGEHYVRGHYSRSGAPDGYSGNHYEKYIDSKHAYRSAGSPECKERLMNTLEDYMDDFARQMEEMLRDSDCAEERTTIKRYLDKIKNLA